MAATCMAVCKGSRKKIRGIFISSCHLPAAVECDIVILSEPGPNPTGPSWAVLQTQLIPARGRKHAIMSGFRKLLDTTYPREGTETLPSVCWLSTPCPDTTYPREGTETGQSTAAAKDTDDTTYPREGTETLSAHLLSSFLKTQLIPARDGNKSSAYFPISSEGHNLSPRGDGNARNSPLIISASATQLIPARGRKPATSLYAPSFIWTQLIPARGRKLLLNATNASVSRHNLSPRGDGWAIVDIGLYYAATTKNMMFCIVVRCPLREYNQGRAQGRRRCLLISEIL